jgi:hypothetical protein
MSLADIKKKNPDGAVKLFLDCVALTRTDLAGTKHIERRFQVQYVLCFLFLFLFLFFCCCLFIIIIIIIIIIYTAFRLLFTSHVLLKIWAIVLGHRGLLLYSTRRSNISPSCSPRKTIST